MAKYLKIDGENVPFDIHLMGSALGMRNRKTYIRRGREYFRPYRNYFGTGIYCADFSTWEWMVKDGLAERTDSAWSEKDENRSYKVASKGIKRLEDYFNVIILPEVK